MHQNKTTNSQLYMYILLYLHICVIYDKKSLKIPKVVIIIPKSKKNKHHNGQKKKDKGINNDLQNITHKTKDRVTRIPLNTEGELMCSTWISGSCCASGTVAFIFKIPHVCWRVKCKTYKDINN
jgi:hypothetical protein